MEVIQINQTEMISALNRAEVDIQIATAKQYPRNITNVLKTIEMYATMDEETAEDCFYALRRGKGDDTAVIEGLSVRMAEIFAGAWGNIRVQTRIIGNDGKTITAQGMCHDLETNFATSVEVKRRITNKSGQTFSEDMQVVTGNAASSIAFRNAVFKVIPKAVTKKVIGNIKQVALGQSIDLEETRQKIVAYFLKIGVTEQQIVEHLEIKKISDINKENVFYLRSLANAIKEGTTSVVETFKKNTADSDKIASDAKQKAEDIKSRTENAMNKANAAAGKPAVTTADKFDGQAAVNVDPETGEVTK
ncbi:hypothetical protein [Dyadobacter sp. LHD-138]|uniref:hypothetical protein n=1 Tax=Dyadobacter sp. LHD-138 TaxID=3071413 RepID=UPI0027DEBC21|nr:hypothetical protein [Dyadobacter sp. LHD-138]MDQ6477836.1 hypothetical protein [Dyadobacter sp. LHD-138]